MSNGLYSRWMEIIATTPSGKTQFVCRICGAKTIAPDKKCAKPFTAETLGGHGDSYDYECHVVEEAICRRMARNEELVLARTQNELLGITQCVYCYGAGCQVCMRPDTRDFPKDKPPHVLHEGPRGKVG